MLLDHGHMDAWHYPLGRVADEVDVVERRGNVRIATEAVLMQAAAGSIMSSEMGTEFKRLVGELTGA